MICILSTIVNYNIPLQQIPTLFIIHYSLFISILVLYISRLQSFVRTQYFEDIPFLDPSVFKFIEDTFVCHLFPESRFCFIVSSWQLPDKFCYLLVVDFSDADIFCVCRCQIFMLDQEWFFTFADIGYRILSPFCFLVLDIFEMIDLLGICLFEHLYHMIQSFIDAEMSRCRDRESMLYQKFFRDLGSDLVLFEECKNLLPELFLIFF